MSTTTTLNFRKSRDMTYGSMWTAKKDGFKFLIEGDERVSDDDYSPWYRVRIYNGENSWKFDKIIRKSWISEDSFTTLDAAKDHLAEVHARLLAERASNE